MTRLGQARRKIRIARLAIGIGAATGLAVFAGLARTSHPATHGTGSTRPTVTRSTNDYFGDDSDSYSYLGPSGSAAPQVQSGAS
jgi:hypothetical protein